MKYEVEDKVRIREDLVVGERYGKDIVVGAMKVHLGKQATITHVSSFDDSSFKVDIDNGAWWWTAEMLAPVGEGHITTPNTLTIDIDKLSDKDKELIKSIVDKVENPFDVPSHRHDYFSIFGMGSVKRNTWINDPVDFDLYMLGNYFLTMEDVEFELEKRKILRKLEILAKKAGVLDWGNKNESKYAMRYNHYDDELRIFEAYGVRCIDRIYFPTKESLQEAINLIGEDNIKKYIFGVED